MHRLQRLSSPSRSLSLLLHLLGLLSFSASFYDLTVLDTPLASSFGWFFQFFTIIGLTLSQLCFALAVLADLSSSPALFALKNAVSVLAAPTEMFISISYWGLHVLDPGLLAPNDFALPLPRDLALHVVPVGFLLLDHLFFSPPLTISTAGAAGLGAAVATVYWFWVELCVSRNGWYPYPLLAMLPPPKRALLFAAAAIIFPSSTNALQWLHARINGSEFPRRKKKKAH